MSNFTGGAASNGLGVPGKSPHKGGCHDPFVRVIALLPTLGMLRLTGLLLGLPLEDNR
jgi:hypothetical protein